MLRFAISVACIAIPMMAQTAVIQPETPNSATETRTFALQSGGSLKISNVDGDISISAWDKNEVAFTAKFVPSSSKEHMRVEIQSAQNSLVINAKQPESDKRRPLGGKQASCQMELKVPRKLIGLFKTVDGSIILDSISGDNRAETVDGAISFKNIQGIFAASSVDGNIKGSHSGPEDGMELSTVDGNIEVKLQNPRGSLEASCVDGSVKLNAPGASNLQTSKRKVSATFGQGGQAIKLRTVDGSIVIN